MKRGSRFDELFTVFFMLCAIGAFACYFLKPNSSLYLVLGGIAILLRIAQYILRYF